MKFNDDMTVELSELEYEIITEIAHNNNTTMEEEVDRYIKWCFDKLDAMDMTPDDIEMLNLMHTLTHPKK